MQAEMGGSVYAPYDLYLTTGSSSASSSFLHVSHSQLAFVALFPHTIISTDLGERALIC